MSCKLQNVLQAPLTAQHDLLGTSCTSRLWTPESAKTQRASERTIIIKAMQAQVGCLLSQ